MVHILILLWIFMATTIEVEGGECKKQAKCWKMGGSCFPWDEVPAGSTAFMKGKKPVACGKKCGCYDAGPSAVLITGGAGVTIKDVDEVRLYPQSCPTNPLPHARAYHVTFKMNGPTLGSCGGTLTGGDLSKTSNSCIVFDKASKHWIVDPAKLGNLEQPRKWATAVTLNNGIYILGGATGSGRDLSLINTSEWLPNGASAWETGPHIPGFGSYHSCSIAISELSFLLIGGGYNKPPYSNEVWEYHHPSDSWTSWPHLNISRRATGCAKIGNKIVISGGYNEGKLDSTEIIHLDTKTVSRGGPLPTPVFGHGMLTVGSGAFEHILAFGGLHCTRFECVTTDVSIWDDSTETWSSTTPDLDEALAYMGSISVEPGMVCS